MRLPQYQRGNPDGFVQITHMNLPIKTTNISYGMYRQVSNIRRALIGNEIVDNSDVVGASPVGAAPTTSSLSPYHLASADWA